MKTLYFECSMGAAGDMLMSALYELLDDQAGFLHTMNHLLPGVTVKPTTATTCGITGTHLCVEVHGTEEHSHDVSLADHEHCHDEHCHDEHCHCHEHTHEHTHEHPHKHAHSHEHDHHHFTPANIAELLDRMDVPEEVRRNAKQVYRRIAKAEAAVHDTPVNLIHFHEVGSLDAVADVTGVCLAMHMLSPEKIVVSPIHLGSGHVHCAHGILPVPAPATAKILQGIPCYTGDIKGELCTPTGAALLAHFAQEFGTMPVMRTEKCGYGLGTKVFPAANCVRAFWGTTDSTQANEAVELCCHIDDMTAEALAFAGERLLEQGALDISYAPLTMKKGRPGVSFTVLCRPADEERMAQAILLETSTNGVRARHCNRYILTPSARTVDTAYGPIRIKCAEGAGVHHEKPEYEDVAAAARRENLPFQQVWETVLLQCKN